MRPFVLGAATALMVFAGTAQQAWACRADQVEIRGDFGTVRFRIELADTPAERAQGLMFVRQMPQMSGMLFVYERPESVSFWMENTPIPLDMIFADATGTIQRVHAEAVPFDRTPIPGGDGIQYVLEINGGLAESFGITAGDVMRHSAMMQNIAAWPCGAP
ncbi:DUF192 domain-containing protein [Roseicyclus sp.]|uniref:DUF192 domain-containing protein n=1 Tax=Roseicyclus sp. TaxID=1914329 RepID=UPI003F6C1FC6